MGSMRITDREVATTIAKELDPRCESHVRFYETGKEIGIIAESPHGTKAFVYSGEKYVTTPETIIPCLAATVSCGRVQASKTEQEHNSTIELIRSFLKTGYVDNSRYPARAIEGFDLIVIGAPSGALTGMTGKSNIDVCKHIPFVYVSPRDGLFYATELLVPYDKQQLEELTHLRLDNGRLSVRKEMFTYGAYVSVVVAGRDDELTKFSKLDHAIQARLIARALYKATLEAFANGVACKFLTDKSYLYYDYSCGSVSSILTLVLGALGELANKDEYPYIISSGSWPGRFSTCPIIYENTDKLPVPVRMYVKESSLGDRHIFGDPEMLLRMNKTNYSIDINLCEGANTETIESDSTYYFDNGYVETKTMGRIREIDSPFLDPFPRVSPHLERITVTIDTKDTMILNGESFNVDLILLTNTPARVEFVLQTLLRNDTFTHVDTIESGWFVIEKEKKRIGIAVVPKSFTTAPDKTLKPITYMLGHAYGDKRFYGDRYTKSGAIENDMLYAILNDPRVIEIVINDTLPKERITTDGKVGIIDTLKNLIYKKGN